MSEKNNEILKYIKTKIDLWIKDKDGRNLSVLARRTGQSYSYIYRLSRQDAEVNLQKLTPVLDEICSDTEIVDFYNTYFKEVATIASRYSQYSAMMNKANPGKAKKAGELKEYLKNPSYFHIIALCASDKGISKDSIVKQLGTIVNELIDELVDKKLLALNNEGKLFLDGHIFVDDRAVLLSSMKSTLDIFSKKKDGVVYSFDNNCYTIESIQAIQAKMKDMDEFLDQLRKDPNSRGEIPFCYVSALGRIDFTASQDESR